MHCILLREMTITVFRSTLSNPPWIVVMDVRRCKSSWKIAQIRRQIVQPSINGCEVYCIAEMQRSRSVETKMPKNVENGCVVTEIQPLGNRYLGYFSSQKKKQCLKTPRPTRPFPHRRHIDQMNYSYTHSLLSS